MGRIITATAGGVCWTADPELLAGAGLGRGAPPLAEWLADGRAVVVKDAPHCAVYRVAFSGLDFHLKHYRPVGVRGRLRSGLRGSKARLEYQRARAVAARGVPTPEPLAFAEAPESEGSYLLTRTLANAQPLAEFVLDDLPTLEPRRHSLVRRRLAVALGEFLARLHAAGLTHADLHPGNILLALGPADEPRLFLIDLHAVRLSEPLPWPRRLANLVVLNRWFVLRSSRADRRRCWLAYFHAYAKENPADASPNSRAAGREIETRTHLSNLRFWRARDQRCLGGNRWFRRLDAGNVVGHAVADLAPEVMAPLFADPDEPFRRPGVVVLKDSPSSTVVEIDLPVGGGVRRVVYKRFAATRWSDPLAAMFRPPPARRSYVLGHGLRLRGLPTPRPLAVLHRRRLGLCAEGYLLAEKVPEAVDLAAHAARLNGLADRDRRPALHALLDRAARLIADLHDRRLSHRDLKAANLLASPARWVVGARGAAEIDGPTPALADYQLWLVDLVGVRVRGRLSTARRARDLSRLGVSFLDSPAVSRTDRLRFLRAYLRWGLHGRGNWKEWWRAIDDAVRVKVRRNRRKGRALG
jgi:tRNA A-37 threonylcarbamoyl transferase component Bud32